jgi:hypothetical protein
MRKAIMMTGTILIVAVILISGSAVATWRYVTWIDENDTTNTDGINGAENNDPISLGKASPPPPSLGWVLVDLSSNYTMPNSTNFTVFAGVSHPWATNESYDVFVCEDLDGTETYVGTGWDGANYIFQTPPIGGNEWRYIYLYANVSSTAPDPVPGAEIDAVGWDEP